MRAKAKRARQPSEVPVASAAAAPKRPARDFGRKRSPRIANRLTTVSSYEEAKDEVAHGLLHERGVQWPRCFILEG
jgi:hypothetical protein